MSVARFSRDHKRQLGQYLTPDATAAAIIKDLGISSRLTILEPSFGEGAFLFPIADRIKTEVPRANFLPGAMRIFSDARLTREPTSTLPMRGNRGDSGSSLTVWNTRTFLRGCLPTATVHPQPITADTSMHPARIST